MLNGMKRTNRILLLSMGLLLLTGTTIGLAEETMVTKPKVSQGDNTSTWKPLGYGMGREFGSMRATIAKTLNMTEEQVYIERLKGKSIAEIAQEKGVSLDTLVGKMMETRKVQINKWVQEKKLTEAEAKTILERMEKNMRASLERKGYGPRGKGDGLGQMRSE